MNRAREVALTLLATLTLAGCGEHVPTEVVCKLPSGEIVSGPSVFDLRDSEGFAVAHSYDNRCKSRRILEENHD